MSEGGRERITSVIEGYDRRAAFYVVALDGSMSFGYNPDEVFGTSSTIKAPYALYCYKKISEGEYSLEDTKVYESRFYVEGSGVIQHQGVGRSYSVRELLYNAIHYSDNLAYYMLLDHFEKDGYNAMLDELGCTNLHLSVWRKWSETSPRDALIVWREIYKFKDECEEGELFFDDLLNAPYSYIKNALPEYESAHKSGWAVTGFHDTGIVFADTPYYVAVMTDANENVYFKEFFGELMRGIDDVMREYGEFRGVGGG
jgi:beta-lactamase class A